MIDLKVLCGDAFRITWDESAEIPGQTSEDRAWLQQIPGKFGHVSIHGEDTLSVFVRTAYDSTDRLGRLEALPGCRVHQRGDHEASLTFPPEHLPVVLEIIRAKPRRRLSEAHRRKLIEAGSGHRFAPGPREGRTEYAAAHEDHADYEVLPVETEAESGPEPISSGGTE